MFPEATFLIEYIYEAGKPLSLVRAVTGPSGKRVRSRAALDRDRTEFRSHAGDGGRMNHGAGKPFLNSQQASIRHCRQVGRSCLSYGSEPDGQGAVLFCAVRSPAAQQE